METNNNEVIKEIDGMYSLDVKKLEPYLKELGVNAVNSIVTNYQKTLDNINKMFNEGDKTKMLNALTNELNDLMAGLKVALPAALTMGVNGIPKNFKKEYEEYSKKPNDQKTDASDTNPYGYRHAFDTDAALRQLKGS